MKITKIDNVNTFKGLWGETIKIKESKQSILGLDVSDYETRLYHPFGDESIEDLSMVQKNNSTFKTQVSDTFNGKNSCVKKRTGTNISIQPSLLFSAKQWLLYATNKLALKEHEIRLIENNLKILHLERYLKI